MNFPVAFWIGVFLLLLARGLDCSEESAKFDRFSKFEPDSDMQQLSTSDAHETYNVMAILRELIQRQQQQRQQQQRAGSQHFQVYNNGEDLSDNNNNNQIDWRKIPLPLPLLHQIRAIINDGTKDKDKRGSYMLPCHFKVCNLG